jgi:AraC-like DNA-binding protein
MIYYLPNHDGYILHEYAQQYYGAGAGYLSIKSFRHGAAHYTLGQRRYVVDHSTYLVLNHGQNYAIDIDSNRMVESFCLFFAPGFAEDVYRSLATSPDRLLDDPFASAENPVSFVERTYPHDTLVSPALAQLRVDYAQFALESGWLIEQFYTIIQRLLHVHTHVASEIARVPATRAATRAEIYRRLHYARDYAAALFAEPISIHDLAHVAGLSPNHLLRTFKHVFHQTPYQYITSRRIAYAQTLLRATDQSVTEICFAVGFASVGAFSWWFRQRVGVSPTDYRRQNR